MYKYLFGPVPSRRLGVSLGIDLVPHKICSLNCIYCECGSTTKLTIERKEYVPYKNVIEELGHYIQNNPAPDYITFSGSGEPTLNSYIGDVISFIKNNILRVPIAVLTNGTLFYQKQVRNELLDVNVVLPSLDVASDSIFRKINRPFSDLNTEKHIQGLIDFRTEFKGEIWLEVFIVPDYNDNIKELDLLKKAFNRIKPDVIQLNTLDRPGAISKIYPVSREELQKIKDYWHLENVEIIAKAPARKNLQSYRKDFETAILETIRRRPCTLHDLTEVLGLNISEINKYLDVLESDDKIETIQGERGIFYKLKTNSHYKN